jgi:adenosine kinase
LNGEPILVAKIILIGRLADKLEFSITGSLDKLSTKNQVHSAVESGDAIRTFDGMAYHVAYGLVCLGTSPTVISQVGMNFDWYFRPYLEGLGLDLRIFSDLDRETACIYWVTDEKGHSLKVNQENSYRFFAENQLIDKISSKDLKEYSAGFIATGKAEADTKFITELSEQSRSLPIIYSPGSNIDDLTKWRLEQILERIALLVCHEEELKLIEDRMKKERTDLITQFSTLKYIITIHDRTKIVVYGVDSAIKISEGPADEINRITGWENAFRAGIVFGVATKKTITEAARLGSALASYAVEREQYSPSPEQVALRAFEVKAILRQN